MGGRVRIELTSADGDPYLYLLASDGSRITDNDDGGDGLDACIERFLPAGIYFIEATTYLARDYQPLRANFTLTVHLVDEATRQQSFHLKIEETHVPDEVVAGDPFTVNYRVGNAGGGDLPADGSTVTVYVVGRRVFEILPPLTAARGALAGRGRLPHRGADGDRHERGDRRGDAVRGHLRRSRPQVGVRRCHHG